MQALIDYVSVTFPDHWGYKDVQRCVMGTSDWEECDTGWRNYERSARRGNVRMAWGGQRGIHLEMTGQGCREVDSEMDEDWREKFSNWLAMGASFCRVDVAFDDFEGTIVLDEVEAAMRSGALVSRADKGQKVEEIPLSGTKEQVGKTLYVGSLQSDTSVRFYDKAAEQKLSGLWVRCELQLRRDRAHIAVEQYVKTGVEALAGILAAHVRFVEPSTAKRKYEAKTVKWWEVFTEKVAALRIAVKREVKTVEAVRSWFEKQVAPMLAILTASVYSRDILAEVASAGKERWNTRHRMILQAAGYKT